MVYGRSFRQAHNFTNLSYDAYVSPFPGNDDATDAFVAARDGSSVMTDDMLTNVTDHNDHPVGGNDGEDFGMGEEIFDVGLGLFGMNVDSTGGSGDLDGTDLGIGVWTQPPGSQETPPGVVSDVMTGLKSRPNLDIDRHSSS